MLQIKLGKHDLNFSFILVMIFAQYVVYYGCILSLIGIIFESEWLFLQILPALSP